MTTMAMGQSEGTWSVTTRVIVYAAIGAALYAVFNFISFGIAVPWSNEVSVRPHYGLLTFFGFAFGPVVGFLTGFVGNVLGDQLSNYGAFTSWQWSVANGLVGMICGLFPVWMASRMTTTANRAVTAAVAGVVATVIGFLFIFVEVVTQQEMSFNAILTTEYIPVIIVDSIAAAIVTPILVLAWEPLKEQLGR
jgi:energy-coupling factor transport system substrate-specific component